MISPRFDAFGYFRVRGNSAEPRGTSITPGERRPLRLGETGIGFLQAASGKERRPVDRRGLWERSVMLSRNGLQMQTAPFHIQHDEDHAGDIHRGIKRFHFTIASRRKKSLRPHELRTL